MYFGCFVLHGSLSRKENITLKVHKREKFFVSDFEFFTIL